MAKKATSTSKTGTRAPKAPSTGRARKPRTVVDPGPDRRTVLEIPAPVALGSILGQDRAIALLRAALDSGRLHHAWIFHGPEGVGKFTLAHAWAALLLDPTTGVGLTGELGVDESGPTHKLLAAGTHPDLHIVCKELARFSDDKRVRDSKLTKIPREVIVGHLIEPAYRAPVMRTDARASKVIIVDEAEMLDTSMSEATSQNAMLKVLEEPPAGTVIILVTSSEDRLLPTIRSRCQRIAFDSLSMVDLTRWLDGSELRLGDDERAWLIEACDGSPGRLIALHRAGAYGWSQVIAPMLDASERGQYAPALGTTMGKLVDEWAAGWVKEGAQLGEERSKDVANRVGARRMLALIADRARNGLGDPRRADGSLRAIDAVGRAQTLLDRHVNLKLVFEHLGAALSDAR